MYDDSIRISYYYYILIINIYIGLTKASPEYDFSVPTQIEDIYNNIILIIYEYILYII